MPCRYGTHHLLCSPCSCKPPNPLGRTARATSPIWCASPFALPRGPALAPSATSPICPLTRAIWSSLPSRGSTCLPPIRSNCSKPWTTADWPSSTTLGRVFISIRSLPTSARPANGACSSPSSIAGCSSPAPSSLWLTKLRGLGWLKPAVWRPTNHLTRTISTLRWISSTGIAAAPVTASLSEPSSCFGSSGWARID